MKTEKEIRDRVKDLELMIEKDPGKSDLYSKWLDAMYWVLEEYCSGLDCAWCSNTECMNM